jgi:hypothetical protein
VFGVSRGSNHQHGAVSGILCCVPGHNAPAAPACGGAQGIRRLGLGSTAVAVVCLHGPWVVSALSGVATEWVANSEHAIVAYHVCAAPTRSVGGLSVSQAPAGRCEPAPLRWSRNPVQKAPPQIHDTAGTQAHARTCVLGLPSPSLKAALIPGESSARLCML